MLRWLVAVLIACCAWPSLALAEDPTFIGHGQITERKIKPKQRLEARDRAKRAAIADVVWRAVVDELGEGAAEANREALEAAVLPRAPGLLAGDAAIVDEKATSTTYDVTVEATVDRKALRAALERVALKDAAGPSYSVAVVVDEYIRPRGGVPSRALAADGEAPPPLAPATRGLDRIARDALATEDRVALVVGNAAYEMGSLRNPVRDARAIAERLRELGFDVETVLDVSQSELIKAIRRFGDRLQVGGTGLFFYAGHGIQSLGRNFMIPIDAGIRAEAQVESEGVNVDRVLGQMKASDNRLNIVILDACRNNPFESNFRSLGGSGLSIIDPPEGTLIAFATNPNNVASDGEGENGLYTEALLANMGRPGVSLEDTFKAVRAQVSRKSGGAQVPQEYTSLTGHFYFADAEGGIPDLPAPAVPPSQSTTFFNIVTQDRSTLTRARGDAASAVAIEAQLKARRIRVVDPAEMGELRQRLVGENGDAPMVTSLADLTRLGETATDFGERYAADAMVVGATLLRPDGRVGEGFRSYASLAARLVDAATGEVLASSARNASGLGPDAKSSQTAAARRVGEIVGEDLAEGLRKHFRDRERTGWPLTLRVTGAVDAGLADVVRAAAEGVDGVRAAEIRLIGDEVVEVLVTGDVSPRLFRPRILQALRTQPATRRLRETVYTRGVWTWEAR